MERIDGLDEQQQSYVNHFLRELDRAGAKARRRQDRVEMIRHPRVMAAGMVCGVRSATRVAWRCRALGAPTRFWLGCLVVMPTVLPAHGKHHLRARLERLAA